MLQFRINKQVIEQVKLCVEAYGVCYLNGCGNYYIEQHHSENKKKFTNSAQEEATYTICFKKGDSIPDTVEAMIDAMVKTRMNENEQKHVQEVNQRPGIKVPKPVVEKEPAEDLGDQGETKGTRGRPKKD